MRPGAGSTFDALSRCVDDVYRWFLENGMMLNLCKTEAVLFDTRVQQAKVDTAFEVEVAGVSVPFGDSASEATWCQPGSFVDHRSARH